MNGEQYSEEQEEKNRVATLKKAIITLQNCLQGIVESQKKELQGDEEYQKKFYKLCNDIGVDPFTQKKGFLSGILNKNLDEYYKALGMRVLNICLKTRYENGGLIKLQELKSRLNAPSINKKGDRVHSEDIRIAVQKLSCLSSSLSIEKINDEVDGVVEYVKSADMEFSADSLKILAKANRRKGMVQVADMGQDKNDKWRKELDVFVSKGIAWIDIHDNICTYYFPTIVFGSGLYVC